MVDARTADQLKAVNTFLGKSDGRDKLCATIQYACMFIAAGQPGNSRKVMSSVAAARKVFRILRPLENITPLLVQPNFVATRPRHTQAFEKLKSLLNTLYFGADHVVWASQAGILTNKSFVDRAQKLSLWSWFGASCCTIASELTEILRAALPAILVQEPEEEDAVYIKRQQAAVDEINKRGLVLLHASVQALLAVGLLQLRPWKPRAVGFLGVVASAINCYMLFPALPKSEKRIEASPATSPAKVGASSPSKGLPLPPASPQPKVVAKTS